MFADVGKIYVVAQPGTSNGERITFQRPRELRHARGFSFGQQDHPRAVWREGGEPSREPNRFSVPAYRLDLGAGRRVPNAS